MTNYERLYETMGELLYVTAMADGVIQPEEISALEAILKDHAWAEQINWSFNYERTKNTPIDELYSKVINTCHQIGPSPVYTEFITVLEKMASAANGIDENEEKVIRSFSTDLIARFQRDLENN